MKFIKNAVLIVLFVFLSTLGVLWAVTTFIQPDTFRIIAKKQLSSITQQNTTIEGDVNWRLFPRPGLHLTKVHIGNIEKPTKNYAVDVNSVVFHLQLTPLFHGKIVFDKLMLDGFTLHINQNNKAPQKTNIIKPDKSKQAAPAIPTRIALKSLLLSNGKIILTDTKQKTILKNVRLETKLPETQEELFPIQFKATIQRKPHATFPLSGTVSYKGFTNLPPLKTISTQLERLTLDGQVTLENFQAGEYAITKANAHILLRHGVLELNPLTLSLYNGESVGKLTYTINTRELSFNQTGTNLNAEPVFQAFFDIHPSRITGLLDLSVNASAKLDQADWHKKMKVNGNFTVHNGTLAYINLPALTAEAKQTILTLASQNIDKIQTTLEHLKPWNLNNYSGNTPFQLFNLQYQAKGDGFVHYNLLLETKKLNLKGQGHINIETRALDAHLTAYIITKDKTTQTIQHILGQGFPLVVKGTLDTPLVNADRRLIRHVLSNGALPQSLIKPLKKLKKHIKPLQYVPIKPLTE
ncbi:MAG: AsmA family protein [Legionellaceae bacterium]|nr:AsmA family protein [Legionellaceae bacterium]